MGQKWVPKINPGKWNQGLKPAVPCYFHVDPHPHFGPMASTSAPWHMFSQATAPSTLASAGRPLTWASPPSCPLSGLPRRGKRLRVACLFGCLFVCFPMRVVFFPRCFFLGGGLSVTSHGHAWHCSQSCKGSSKGSRKKNKTFLTLRRCKRSSWRVLFSQQQFSCWGVRRENQCVLGDLWWKHGFSECIMV